MFPIKKLPAETRVMIYPDALQLQHDGLAPALLLALAADEVLYNEAFAIYRKINANVGKKNEDSFKKQSLSRLLKLKYIRISWDRGAKEIELKTNKVLLRNNLEVITLDLPQLEGEYGRHWNSHHAQNSHVYLGALLVPKALIRASSAPKKLMVKFYGWISQEIRRNRDGQVIKDPASEFIDLANAALQVVGKLERVTPTNCSELWFWEEDGVILRWI